MTDIRIEQEDPRRADVMRLVAALDAYHNGLYPPEACHHLDIEALCKPDIVFLVARRGEVVLGIGALWLRSELGFGEVKRMFVTPEARGLGIAGKILARIEQTARDNRISILRLETGTENHAALELYRRAGFGPCGPFGDYPGHPMSVFMEKRLAA